MKKVSNTFNKGLTMDVSPLSTTGDSLSDCLNGTFCTMNGDELVLLNDMGNGRVLTAYLPEGYIPVGTTQLGGIIYVASYNPFTNKCLIGSFPSPLRTSDKRDTISKEIPLDKDEDITRVVLSDLIFKPGDKFYLTIPEQYMQYKYTEDSNTIDAVKQHFLKFSVAIISEESQIIKLDEDPIILEPTSNNKNNNEITEDDFHKDINKFKVCTSKISGKLVLIIERVIFDYSINFNAFSGISANNSNPTFYLNFNLNANSLDKFFPNRLVLTSLCKYANTLYGLTLTFPEEGEFTSGNYNNFHSFDYSAKNIYNNDVIDPVTATTINRPGSSTVNTTISKLIERLTNIGYWNKAHDPVYLKINAAFYTNNFKIDSNGEKIGECLPTTTKLYVIDLSKVASNTVELSRYTYIINEESSTSVEITFELKTYLDSKYEIKDTTVTIYNVKDDSVNRVYSESLGKSIRPVDFTNLENNYLYLVEFLIKIGTIEEQDDGSFDENIINIYRYLYSNRSIVNSFDLKLNDYELAVPKVELLAKVKDGTKLIPNEPNSREISYPNGLASTDDIEFKGIEKQVWDLEKLISINITVEGDTPIKINSITANNKEYYKNNDNSFTIDTGLQPQEKTFTYIYHKPDKISKECNLLERVSDYLYISNTANDCVRGFYPGRDKNNQLSYDYFNADSAGGAGNSFNASNFFKFYSGSSDTSGYDEYDEKFYGYSNTSTQYRWQFIKFEVMQNTKGRIDEVLPLDINIYNAKESNFYLLTPGGGRMLFTLLSLMSFDNLYNSIKEIFDILYTFRQKRNIDIYCADSVQSKKIPDPINILKTIKVSNINMDFNTSNNLLFTLLIEIYDKYYSKNNYKKPIINNLQIELNEYKDISTKSKLVESYSTEVNFSNGILVKSNNILYTATYPDLSDNKIYFVTPSVDNVNIFESVSDSYLLDKLTSGITYKGITKRFKAVSGRLYTYSTGHTYRVELGYGETEIDLLIKVEPTLN